MERISIVGMNSLGLSIGSGLKQAELSNTEVVGVDRDRESLKRASKFGAVDITTRNLRTGLDGAQLVILNASLPDTEILLKAIAPILSQGCVVTDTGISKMRVMEYANKILPEGTNFVGGRPIPKQNTPGSGVKTIVSLKDGFYCIFPTKSTDFDSIKTVLGLVEAIDAKPIFLDAYEHDSYTTGVSHLPSVLATALINLTSKSPSWRDMSKLAGTEYHQVSQPASEDPKINAAHFLSDPDSMVLWIDRFIDQLNLFKSQIKEDQDGMLNTLINAWEQRAIWKTGGVEDTPEMEKPSVSQTMGQMFLGSHLLERYRKFSSSNNKSNWKYERNP